MSRKRSIDDIENNACSEISIINEANTVKLMTFEEIELILVEIDSVKLNNVIARGFVPDVSMASDYHPYSTLLMKACSVS